MKTEKEIVEKIKELEQSEIIMGAAEKRYTLVFIYGLKWCLGITD